MHPPLAYRAPVWLKGGHAQTVFASCLLPLRRPPYVRQSWQAPDRGQVAVDCIEGRRDKPVITLFYGLEGDSYAHYAKAFGWFCLKQGWSLVIPHIQYRVGGHEPRRSHAGSYARVDWAMGQVARRHAGRPLFATGISFGGNLLLKWLADTSAVHARDVQSAVVASVPLDLLGTIQRFCHGAGPAYKWYLSRAFLREHRPAAVTDPELACHLALARMRRRSEFEALLRDPMPGYGNVRDYLEQASSIHDLSRIRTPTLIINARNDPCLGAASYPEQGAVSQAVILEYPEHGGHVGFVTGAFPGRFEWLPHRATQFMLAAGLDKAPVPPT